MVKDFISAKTSCQRYVYLLRWLKASAMNVHVAYQMLQRNQNWRRANGIDNILTEDFISLIKVAPYDLDEVDHKGRPVLFINFGKWDIRRIYSRGQLAKLGRFMDQMLEKGYQKLTEVEMTNHNITQGIVLIDMEGYNFRQHGCSQCLGVLFNWVRNFEQFYPSTVAELHILNAPRIFLPLLDLIKPLLSPETRRVLKINGHPYSKDTRSSEILKSIPIPSNEHFKFK